MSYVTAAQGSQKLTLTSSAQSLTLPSGNSALTARLGACWYSQTTTAAIGAAGCYHLPAEQAAILDSGAGGTLSVIADTSAPAAAFVVSAPITSGAS